ncbi:hypothetical protein FB550_1075 [Neobacillus bataviensis]|uniref:TM2 domain-containing protein n=1 Tax=Neobacillus bataviensis TaxID=220685 RepID=A0A561D7Q1_9BACI|nr:hypothetical protein [Neobacillus bataviensis]TWD99370.1 hypothetical protein FB550_1075 [Neobacillus bataviensis]
MKLVEQLIYSFLTSKPRRIKMEMGPFSLNYFDSKHPWVVAWWSAAIPGFGHIHLGLWLKGLILMSGEIIINLYGNVNLIIIYSFTGQFDRLNEGLINYNYIFLYGALYIFGIWDAYRVSVDINKVSYLESKQEVRVFRCYDVSSLDLNYLDKRNPWIAAFWSAVFIGIGHLYNHKLLNGFILLTWGFVAAIQTNLPYIIIYTLTGQFERINEVIDYRWFLFFPSIYFFAIYDAYSSAVGYNRLFKEEQQYYLNSRFKGNKLEVL